MITDLNFAPSDSGVFYYTPLIPGGRRVFAFTEAQVREFKRMTPNQRMKEIARKKGDGEFKGGWGKVT